ncbi:chromosome segregation in meiosis protein 3 [Moniliophthora roreri MCA 2997]|uniref:Chromosome segregation in meiosis protein n=1 Tax=Moniliophthora roreri (strain MCA 2997) TaxID=1381753 RepID=V2YSA5_MONRO|nr:chromosome segregation in meiosis protein 3 [Moniliophthora roreri MCA 2997]
MEPLFLPDEEEQIQNSRNSPPAPPPEDIDIDAIFKEFEEETVDDHVFDLAATRRRAEARYKNAPLPKATQREILPSRSPPRDLDDSGAGGSSKAGNKDSKKDGEKKEKKKPMRLDETRLLGPTGFRQLIKDTKDFKPKGKGHEARDLDRLLQVYQFWAHRMYPKSQFSDTIERIEKLCHSKRMNVALSVWRDEAHGKNIPSGAEDEDQVIDLTDNEGGATEGNHSDAAQYASSSPVPPTRPPSSPDTSGRSAIGAEDDDELDAVMRDLEERRQRELAAKTDETPTNTNGRSLASSSSHGGGSMDVDDDELWAAFDDIQDSGLTTSTSATDSSAVLTSGNVSGTLDDDEEMWDVVREIGQAEGGSKPAIQPATPAQEVLKDSTPGAGPGSGNTSIGAPGDDDWEDMYI